MWNTHARDRASSACVTPCGSGEGKIQGRQFELAWLSSFLVHGQMVKAESSVQDGLKRPLAVPAEHQEVPSSKKHKFHESQSSTGLTVEGG